MSIDSILNELRRDQVHGASWYFLKGIELLEIALGNKPNKEEIRPLLNEIRDIRPGMASLLNLTYVIDRALSLDLDLGVIINRLKETYEKALENLSKQLDRFPVMCGSGVMTISYSSAVRAALSRWGRCIVDLYIMESRPGNEITQAIKDYSNYVSSVVPIPDSAIASFMSKVNYVIVGADGLYSDGYFLNKVGTETLLIVARKFNVNTIVVAEAYKAVTGGVNDVYTISVEIGGLSSRVPLLDKAPLDLVDHLITDFEIIKKPKPGDIEDLREYFINNVLRVGE